jgi:hypothetical protein
VVVMLVLSFLLPTSKEVFLKYKRISVEKDSINYRKGFCKI